MNTYGDWPIYGDRDSHLLPPHLAAAVKETVPRGSTRRVKGRTKTGVINVTPTKA